MKYASLGMQFFVSLGLAVFVGLKADKWLHLSMPLLVWVLPLIVICVLMYQIIRDTSNRKSDDDKKTI